MGKILMGNEDASGDTMINMGTDKSVLILIKHCQDMKKQETRLRFVTLLLLFSCAAMFISTIIPDLRQLGNSRSSKQENADENSSTYSLQQSACPAATDYPKRKPKTHHISLKAAPANSIPDGQYMIWTKTFGDMDYDEKNAFVIPETGEYFVYISITLGCQEDHTNEKFNVQLRKFNSGYNEDQNMINAWNGVVCSPHQTRTLFMGELFDLLKGDHVKVFITYGYNLITTASFGAYLI
ncbi:uncharacterized protein LOC111221201 [Scomber scombrus]|uniref:Uncharacterized protein LOC111221201 n=1 Tax=Scomber scombrus TaxID=13677 RepID=A0AAV1Q061_SCOSC